MVFNRTTAVARAKASTTNEPGMCQKWTRLIFGAPSVGDVDRDGDADAVDGWKSENLKHPGDRNPPIGVPVAFSGGSHGNGHRAVVIGRNGVLRSTDMNGKVFSKGHVGTTTIADCERVMGVKYLGWSEDISGIPIPKPSTAPTPPKPPVQETSYVLDVSHHQFDKGFTLAMAWKQGYRHVILKLTQGVGYVDPKYKSALAEAKKLGFRVAVYHFLEEGNGAKQAANAAKNIGDKSIPLWIDVEQTRKGKPDESNPTLKDWAAFREAGVKLGLKIVGKYLNEEYWKGIGRPGIDGPLKLWRPAYPTLRQDYASKLYPGNQHARWDPFGGQKPILWQFTQNAKINGYSGGVDVSAFRGTHAELNKLNLFKSFASAPEPKPTPTPAPTPAPKPADKPVVNDKTMSFTVNLVPGNKNETAAQIKADMKLVKSKSATSGVIFNTERTPAQRTAMMEELGKGYTSVRENECVIALGSDWSVESSNSILLAKEDPSMAGVSPRRYLNDAFVKNRRLADAEFALLGTHLLSEANCIHTKVKGRAWRETMWPVQVEDVLTEVQRVHDLGVPVVLAGDFNTGVNFNGKKLFGLLQVRFGKNAVHVHNGALDHIFLIGTDKVRLEEIGTEVKTDNKSDHDMVTAKVKATLL